MLGKSRHAFSAGLQPVTVSDESADWQKMRSRKVMEDKFGDSYLDYLTRSAKMPARIYAMNP